MTAANLGEAAAGLLLVFFLPGYTTTRALFPEWRLRGSEAWRRGVETVTLGFVLSIGWTVVIAYLLLEGGPSGFAASWTDPALEAALTLVTVIAFLVGWWEGAYARVPPQRTVSSDPGGEGAWELTRRLEDLGREERRLEHSLRTSERSSHEADVLRVRLDQVREESSRLGRERQEQYAR